MQNFIENLNIARFKTRLACESDPAVRATLTQLLEEEEAKHALRVAINHERVIEREERILNA